MTARLLLLLSRERRRLISVVGRPAKVLAAVATAAAPALIAVGMMRATLRCMEEAEAVAEARKSIRHPGSMQSSSPRKASPTLAFCASPNELRLPLSVRSR